MTTPESPTSLVCLHLSQSRSVSNPFFPFLGGNSLERAPVGRVHDFVKVNGGHTVITKVSIIGLLPLFSHTYIK